MEPIIPDASPAPAPRSSRWVEYAWAAGLLALAAWFYLWTATSAGSPLTSRLQHDDLYNRLADGFLAGRLSLLEKPDPALANLADPWDPAQNAPYARFHDVSYFGGKYYLYFGPVPALVLLAPWRLLTGTYLAQNVAAAVFCWAGATASFAVILALKRRYFPQVSGWVAGSALTVAAFGNFVPALLRRPVYYEVAIASAYAFALLGVWLVLQAQTSLRHRRLFLAMAAVAYGLAVGSRPNYVFGTVILAVPLLPAWRDWWACAEIDWVELRRDLLALVAPFGGILVLLLAYNGARFGNPFEFGTSYMLSGLHPQRDVTTSFRFLPANLWFYLFSKSQWIAYFPFFDVIHLPWFSFPAGYTGEEDAYGILPNLPFLWLLGALPFLLRDRWITGLGSLRDLVLGLLALELFNGLVIGRIGGAANRYMVDLLPPLIPLACLGLFWAEFRVRGRWWRWAFRCGWVGALGFTVAFNVAVSLQHNGLLQYYNPAVYRRLAHAFDLIPDWLGITAPDKVGPMSVTLTLPSGRTGQLEPLLVTGLSFRADFIYLYYTDESHLQIGFEHTSYGGPLTKPPLEVDYAVPHRLQLELGSLYPPVEDDYYDRLPVAEIARLKHTLRVTLDGQEVLKGTYDFYDSSPGDVSVGRNPVSDAFGRSFSGRLISASRSGVLTPEKVTPSVQATRAGPAATPDRE